MNKILKTLCVVALGASMAHAGDDKDLKKTIEDQGIYVETAQKGVTLSGYVDTSYTYQFSGKNGSAGDKAIGRQFDVDHNDFNINAFKLALEKKLSDKNEWSAGFRADLMFGEDAKFLNDNGINAGVGNALTTVTGTNQSQFNDGYTLEQAYVQFRVPVGNGLDIKFGKFVTLLGYEVIESPANLNFSRGLLYTNAIPLTHTGVLASYKFNDIVDAQFGIVNGWNNSDSANTGNSILSSANDVGSFGKAITGRVNVTAPGGNANIAQSFIYSPDGESSGSLGTPTAINENESVFVYDIWGNWAPKFANDKLLLGFNLDYGLADDFGSNNFFGPSNTGDTWYGAALYAKYQFTKLFSLAGRSEYYYDKNGIKSIGGDSYSFTLTAGFDIWENLLTRVEYRADYGTAFTGDFQNEVALNLVYSF